MTVTVSGSQITFNDNSTQNTSATGFGFKNRIINGACVIDQRNAGASVTITNTAALTYTIDRWAGYGSVASKFSVQQNAGSVTPPAGFSNYLGATSLSAYTVGASEVFKITQVIEGFNAADLDWGTANAKTVTLSFWVRSSLTGTFGGAFINSAFNRNYPFTYTISSANTWEYKTITVAGDTSGTWLTTNGIGVQIVWSLGTGASLSGTSGAWAAGNIQSATGATSVVGTNGATWYVTGTQLEKGSTATSFDYRPYGTELALCQRYTYVARDANCFVAGAAQNANNIYIRYVLPVPMRAVPTLSFVSSITLSDQYVADYTASTPTVITAPNISDISGRVFIGGFSGFTTGRWYGGAPNDTGKSIFSAEL